MKKKNHLKGGNKMQKRFNFANHPFVVGRMEDLDPNQKGFLRITKKQKERKKVGDAFEKEVSEILSKIEDVTLLNNVYFETGNFIQEIMVYESVQHDQLLIAEGFVASIEDKSLKDQKYEELKIKGSNKTWVLTRSNGKKKRCMSGVYQNNMHKQCIEEILEYHGINDVPVVPITVIGDLSYDKIHAYDLGDSFVVTPEKLEALIAMLSEYYGDSERYSDVQKAIEFFICKDESIEKSHLFYCRHFKDLKIPKKCLRILRKHKDK